MCGEMNLLTSLFAGRLMISDFVEDEIGKANISIPDATITPLTSEDELLSLSQLKQSYPNLGIGEIGAITVAKHHEASLVSNDAQARKAAKKEGLSVAGSLTILHYAVTKGHISPGQATQILNKMIETGSWFSRKLVDCFRKTMKKLNQDGDASSSI